MFSQKNSDKTRSKVDPVNFLNEEKRRQLVLSGFEWFEASLIESSSKTVFEQLLDSSISKKTQFTDIEFPANLNSLNKGDETQRSNWKWEFRKKLSLTIIFPATLTRKGLRLLVQMAMNYG